MICKYCGDNPENHIAMSCCDMGYLTLVCGMSEDSASDLVNKTEEHLSRLEGAENASGGGAVTNKG